jgi:hypothetical protein
MLIVGNMTLASEVTGILSNGEVIIIVSPTASPVPGTYTSAQNIVLTANGATSIRYTTDGTEPNCSTETTYHVAIPVSESLTIKAISCYPNNNSSDVSSFIYVINLPTPNPTPTPTPTPSPSGGGGGGGGTPAGPKPGDANNDGSVNILDFNTMMINWGKTGTGNIADFNSDSKVDILDFNMLMINWTK